MHPRISIVHGTFHTDVKGVRSLPYVFESTICVGNDVSSFFGDQTMFLRKDNIVGKVTASGALLGVAYGFTLSLFIVTTPEGPWSTP